ncbi:MAG TPA: hypothetical protein VEO54_14080 [Thermoanaerobaculia bacterium]|nr:hypothetical protein [Thermoanaerobaculia bacterium]
MNNLAIDPIWVWVALGVMALMLVVGLVARSASRARSASLREKFGNEYDHALSTHGNRKRAEQDLIERTEQVKKYNIVPLQASDRERFRRDWQKVEAHFLERPTTAVVEADELVADIMRTRGYPMGDFDRHAADLSVTHPRIVDHYRAGHKVIEGAAGASTEDLRQAMLHYRALFDELIDDRIGNDVVTEDAVPRANEVDAVRARSVSTAREEELRTRR